MDGPEALSRARGRRAPKIVSNCTASSTTTGRWTGPDAAKPANTGTSMRGSPSADGTSASKRIPGSGRERAIRLLHLEPLVGEDELFERYVGPLGVQRAARVLDDASPHELPDLDDRGVILAHELDCHRAQRVLVAVPDLVQPLVEVQAADHAAFHGHVGRLVHPGD